MLDTFDHVLDPGPFPLPTPSEFDLWHQQEALDAEGGRLARIADELDQRELDLAAREDLAALQRRNPVAAAPSPGGSASAPPGDPVESTPTADLLAAVAALAACDTATLPGSDVLDLARVTQGAISDLTVLGLGQLADIQDRRLHALDDAPSTTVWTQRLAVDVPRGQVALAKRLALHGRVHAALRAGRVTLSGAQALGQVLTRLERFLDAPGGLLDGQPQHEVLHSVLTDGLRQLVCRSRGGQVPDDDLRALTTELRDIAEADDPPLAQLEAGFLVLAREVAPEQLRSCLAVLLAALLPLQLEKAALAGRDRRTLELTRLQDGSGWVLRGHLDLLTGELLFTALEAQLATDPLNAGDTAAGRDLRQDGLDPLDPDLQADLRAGQPLALSSSSRAQQTPGRQRDHSWPTDDVSTGGPADRSSLRQAPRSRGERTHDALRAALSRYLDRGLAGTRGKARPHLSVTVPVEALQVQPGALPAEAASSSCLPASLLVHLWPDSAVTRFVLGLTGTALGASHTSRTSTRLERLATHLHTGGWCQTAGCRRHTSQLGSTFHHHHLDPWALSRSTDLATNALLCESDHRALHDGATFALRDGRRA